MPDLVSTSGPDRMLKTQMPDPIITRNTFAAVQI